MLCNKNSLFSNTSVKLVYLRLFQRALHQFQLTPTQIFRLIVYFKPIMVYDSAKNDFITCQ